MRRARYRHTSFLMPSMRLMKRTTALEQHPSWYRRQALRLTICSRLARQLFVAQVLPRAALASPSRSMKPVHQTAVHPATATFTTGQLRCTVVAAYAQVAPRLTTQELPATTTACGS